MLRNRIPIRTTEMEGICLSRLFAYIVEPCGVVTVVDAFHIAIQASPRSLSRTPKGGLDEVAAGMLVY